MDSRHRYGFRIQVSPLEIPASTSSPIDMTIETHDNIIEIADKLRASELFINEDDASSVAVGLKLLAEVTARYRRDPVFHEINKALNLFTRTLKRSLQSAQLPSTNNQELQHDDYL